MAHQLLERAIQERAFEAAKSRANELPDEERDIVLRALDWAKVLFAEAAP